MEKNYEENALFRFLNVIIFLLYFIVILTSLFGAGIVYTSRPLVSASVQCEDGTKWDAMSIHNNPEALCGICTQRTSDDGEYNFCSIADDNMDYSYEIVDQHYGWSWYIVIVPLVIFFVGFGIVDFFKIAIIYVFGGGVALHKSVILRIIASFASNDASQTAGILASKFPLLLHVTTEEEFKKMSEMLNIVEPELKKAEEELETFFKRTGRPRSFFEKSNKVLDLDFETIEEYFTLDNKLKDLQLVDFMVNKYFESLSQVNNQFSNSSDETEARKLFKKIEDQQMEEIAELKVKLEFSKAIGEELLLTKRQYGKNIKNKTINIDDIIARVEQKHPKWKKGGKQSSK